MKILATAVFTSMLAFGTVAYAKEEPKKATSTAVSPVAAAPAAEVKTAAAAKTKRVCVDVQGRDGKPVIDTKTNKPRQNCVTVKIREKHEGTKIPEKK